MVSFKDLTTIHSGPQIQNFIEIELDQNLETNLRKLPDDIFVIGNGSKLLITDNFSIPNVVKLGTLIDGEPFDKQFCFTRVSAGASLDEFIQYSITREHSKFAFLSQIPGTVGGALYQNAGAYGYSMKDIVYQAKVWDTKNKKFIFLNRDQMELDYRHSIFQDHPEYLIIEVFFKNGFLPYEFVRYQALAEELNLKAGQISSSEKVRAKIIELRKKRNTLYDPDDKNTYSFGSIFKNPPNQYAKDILKEVGISDGYQNGQRLQLSPNNNNVIINSNSATSEEILEFLESIKSKVKSAKQIELEYEVIVK